MGVGVGLLYFLLSLLIALLGAFVSNVVMGLLASAVAWAVGSVRGWRARRRQQTGGELDG